MRTVNFEKRLERSRDFHRTNDGIVSRPLKSLEELLHWNAENIRNQESTKTILSTVEGDFVFESFSFRTGGALAFIAQK